MNRIKTVILLVISIFSITLYAQPLPPTTPSGLRVGTSAGTFTGNVSTDWGTAGNWAGGSVPTSSIDVTIADGKNAVIGSEATAYCNGLTIESGSSLTIESSATGTGSLIVSGTVNGDATVERYMTSGAWHIISSPTPGQTVGAFLTASTTIKANPNAGYETYRALKDYNESGNIWNGLTYTTASADLMSIGKGYAVWPASDGVVSFSGTLSQGDKTATVARAGYGWNCIGNPYSSAIAINTAAGTSNFINVNSDNLDPSFGAIYVWNQSGSSYSVFSLSDETAYYLPVGQGFFVKVKTGASQVSFTSATQQHQPTATFRSTVAESPAITLSASMNGKQSTATLRFSDNATTGLDFGYDAGIFKTGFDIYTKLVEDNGVDFAIQCLPSDPGNGFVMPVGLDATESGEVEFTIKAVNLLEGYQLAFEDTVNNQSYDLAEGNKTMTFNVTSGTTLNRFYINMSKSPTGMENTVKRLIVTSSKGKIIVWGEVKTGSTALLYDLQGRCLTGIQLNAGAVNCIPTTGIREGVYLLRLNQQGTTDTRKIAIND